MPVCRQSFARIWYVRRGHHNQAATTPTRNESCVFHAMQVSIANTLGVGVPELPPDIERLSVTQCATDSNQPADKVQVPPMQHAIEGPFSTFML